MPETNTENGLPQIQNSEPSAKSDIADITGTTSKKNSQDPNTIILPTKSGETSLGAHTGQNRKSSEISSVSYAVEKRTLMDLLDDSAEHLFDLMKGLSGNLPSAEIRMFDPERVRAACSCADQIHKLMRLKFDALKYMNKK